MKSLKEILYKLMAQNSNYGESYPVSNIPSIKRHKIGITGSGNPIFFINCNIHSKTTVLDYNLEMISVKFSKRCKLNLGGGASQEDVYAVVTLKDGYEDLESYFLEIIYLLLTKLPEKLSDQILRLEIGRIVELFNKISQPAKKTLQGLWAELFVIERSSDPDYLLDAWHCDKNDKFDFNDGIDKIEVKSTSRRNRIHTFSADQLKPNKSSDLIIISVMVQQTGIGQSILGLTESIESRLKSGNEKLRLREMIATTLGSDLVKADLFYFDYNLACDSVAFFHYSAIPSIMLSNIPAEISNIKFDVDLSSVRHIKLNEMTSRLYDAL